jgi:hypothetical protein
MASKLAKFESSGYFTGRGMQLLLISRMDFTAELWMPVRLFATAPVSLSACGGP